MMTPKAIEAEVLGTWRRNNEILLGLLQWIPRAGLTAVPAGSRGRDVLAQFAHLDRVRQGWVAYHRSGKRPTLPRYDKNRPPTRAQLRAALARSGKEVERLLRDAVRGEARIRMFGGSPVRWMGYLLAHEAHHRGQILLALKQSGTRLPATVTIDRVWGRWISGR